MMVHTPSPHSAKGLSEFVFPPRMKSIEIKTMTMDEKTKTFNGFCQCITQIINKYGIVKLEEEFKVVGKSIRWMYNSEPKRNL
eukprot:UN16488